ncbi:MAG: response regulator [Chloroflexi bacterium]|nr:response regulator [Chloroflexota bacterium]
MATRILIVDDSAFVRSLHDYIFRSHGFETLLVDSGFAALEALNRETCDLAVVDVNMPRMDGLTLTRHIRADPATAELPIIVLSTERDDRDVVQGLEAGANVYVFKPTDPEALVRHARMLLGPGA